MGTVIVGVIVVGVVGLIVRSMVKDKKSRKSLQCGGDCSHCGGHCHYAEKRKGWSAYAARKYAKRGDPEQTQTAGLQDHKAADAVTRYHTGRRVFQL